jgi:hypothetical protein
MDEITVGLIEELEGGPEIVYVQNAYLRILSSKRRGLALGGCLARHESVL